MWKRLVIDVLCAEHGDMDTEQTIIAFSVREIKEKVE
jgi:hypothetical protein